jgi:nucleotide-binding universal stress UspA family protein
MFRYILVPATGADSDGAVFRTALAIARPSAAHLAFLHVRQDMQHTAFAIAGGDLSGARYDGVIDSVQGEVEQRQRAAHDAVAAFCAREHVMLDGASVAGAPSAEWLVEAGDAQQCLATHGRTADLTVLGRARIGEKVALHLLETVLLESGRPLLIVPETVRATIGQRIAIAWKDSAEAAHAVAAVLPLLASAESVTVFAVQESGDTHNESDSGKRLRRALRWHNRSTTLRVVPRTSHDPAETLLSVIEADGSDLLVMGGYSHSRMREAMFGGFTRSVLLAAGLPVLMAH